MSAKEESKRGSIVLAAVVGLISDLFGKLSGNDGEMWCVALARFLNRENPWPRFSVWCVLEIGIFKSVLELVTVIEEMGRSINIGDLNTLNKVTLATAPTRIELVKVTVKELGFPGCATYPQIYDRALQLGLALCPAEGGLELCRTCTDLKAGELLRVAMEPIADSQDYLHAFLIGHDGSKLILYVPYIFPGDLRSPDEVWVFARQCQ